MSSGRALKPALSLRPSTANRPGMHSRGSSQGSMRSLSRSHTPTPSPSTTAAEAHCYFSIPSASTGTNTNTDVGIGGGGGIKTATRKPRTSFHRIPLLAPLLCLVTPLLVDTADVISHPQQHLADLTQARILHRPTQRANRQNATGGAGPLRLILEAAGRVAGPLIPRLSPCRGGETFTGTFFHCG